MVSRQKYQAGILIAILAASLATGLSLISSSSAQSSAATTSLTVNEARQFYLSAWTNSTFNVSFSTFIEDNSASGYGIYEEHVSDNVFRPGETIVLYVEPTGFEHQQMIDDQTGSTLYLIDMTADYVISDDSGNEERILNIPVGQIMSHNQNTELFLELTLTQQTPFPEGDYILTYIVHDNVSGESFEITKEIRIESASQELTTESDRSSSDQSLDVLDDFFDSDSESSEDSNDEVGDRDSADDSSTEEEEESQPEEESEDCDSAYPDTCIRPPPPDLDCGDISARNFEVGSSDPHRFDNDNDGIGCEE